LGKISEDLSKTFENLGKIPENPGKNGAQSLQENTTLFGGHTKSTSSCSVWEKVCGQKAHKNFLGKFGEFRANILRTPKKLPAPTPV